MAFPVRENKGQDFERVPLGLQPAVAAAVYDLGFQPGYQGKKPAQQYVILWELAARAETGDRAGQRFQVTKTYHASLGSATYPSNLRKDLVSWRKREFTEEELNTFELDRIIGANCTLNLTDKVKGEKHYAQVSGVMPPLAGAQKITSELPPGFVPEWVRKAQAKQLSPDTAATYDIGSQPAAGVADDDIPF